VQEGIQTGYIAMNMETPAPSLPGNQPSAPRVPTSAIARLLVLKSMYSRPLMIWNSTWSAVGTGMHFQRQQRATQRYFRSLGSSGSRLMENAMQGFDICDGSTAVCTSIAVGPIGVGKRRGPVDVGLQQ
jgi:hypothetical protein